MKYISKGINNTITLKLNSQSINTYSGTYIFSCQHIQTGDIINLTLNDISITPNIYQKFIITSGESLNFQSGQYEIQIFDALASTILITEEYFTVYSDANASPVIFMGSGGQDIIYNVTGYTTVPDVPENFNAYLRSDGISTYLNWSMIFPNITGFELWRKESSGGTYISLNNDIQSYIYIDKFLNYSTNYFYKVRAFNNIGYSNFSSEIKISTSSLTGNTGTTSIHIIGSGATKVLNFSGNTFIIYSPSAHTQNFIGSGITTVTKSGDTFIVDTAPIVPIDQIVLLGSGLTKTHKVSGNTWTIFSTGNTGHTGGGDIYTGATPSAISLGGIVTGEVLTGKSYTKLFEELLVPTLYPTLTSPSNTFSSTANNLYEIAQSITFSVTAGFNRGSINPAFGTNGFRAGLPNTYHFNGAQLPANVSLTNLSLTENITSYTVLKGLQTWTSDITYSIGQQPKNSKGGNYNSPYSAGTTGILTINTEGVYPIFATTVTIDTWTKQPLVSMLYGNNFVFNMVAETGGDKQTFAMATDWLTARPITGIQTFNTVSNQWEYQGGSAGTSLTYWTQTPDTAVIQFNVINYTIFTYNGVDRANVQIKIIL